VLADLNLSLNSPVNVLMGPVKTGKSTLFRTLAGLYEGNAMHHRWGHARLRGEDLRPGHRPALVQQHARLLEAPLWQALRQPSQSDPGAGTRSPMAWRDWAVASLQAHGLAAALPLIDRPLIDADPVLQRSVMALAQALAQPGLLLIDEPTYGLDDQQAQRLLAWLRPLGQTCPLWVSLHNQKQARTLADAVVLMGGGRILAHQTCTDFFTHPANALVQQFVRSGSLSLPSPDARPEELEAGTPLPPPLPAPAPPPRVVAPLAPPVPAPVPTEAPPAPPSAEAPVVAAQPPRSVRPVTLPPPLRHGVEMASSVGKVMLSDSRGPQGFRWVVPGVLAGCPQPGIVAPIDHDLLLLDKTGVTHLITLTEADFDQDALHRHHLKNTHLPIFDRKAPSTSQMHMLLVRMQRLIDAGEVLAVHCKAGLGRTGLVLAAWLVRDGGLGAETAIERLRKIHPGFIQSDEQLAFLHAYEADILRRLT
jgi:atypical dual specificity phosphatase